jgi:hypothetical protein
MARRLLPLDPWPLALFAIHLLHGLWFRSLYPQAIQDPDLLAYFVYFRNWAADSTVLHGVSYFTVPKPLLVFVLGPLADASAAFTVSAVVAAGIGALVYLIGRDTFGRVVGVLLSLALLLDVEKAVLTLRSSADLWVTALVLGGLWLSMRRQLVASAVCMLLATLVKPVALPCALHVLALADVPLRRRVVAAALPFLAIPLILLSNQLLLGAPFGSNQFFAGFESLGEGVAIGPDEVLRFVLWSQLAKHVFVSTVPFGVLGIVLWLKEDQSRLTHPYFTVPLLFLGGYVGLAMLAPYVPFYRFYWLVQLWFAGFVLFGMWEVVRRLTRSSPRLRIGLAAGMAFFLVDDAMFRQMDYRERFATPFQNAMAFVSKTPATFASERAPGETVLTPLAFLPWLMWQLGPSADFTTVLTAEQVTQGDAVGTPDWILWVPEIFANREARDRIGTLVKSGGYQVRASDGKAALLALPPHRRAERLAQSRLATP